MITASEKILFASLRVVYDLLYHQFAWSYDLVAATVSLGRWQSWVDSALPYLTGPCVLEIGYGPGHLQVAMRTRGIFAVGVDASPQMSKMARTRLIKVGEKPGITLGYAQNLPFPSSCFDQVVATFPSEYIIDPASLSEIYRVLVAGGVLLIIPFAWLTGNRWYERWMARLLRVTHEAPDWEDRFLQPFIDAGFVCSWTPIHLDSSTLFIIHAQKDLEI